MRIGRENKRLFKFIFFFLNHEVVNNIRQLVIDSGYGLPICESFAIHLFIADFQGVIVNALSRHKEHILSEGSVYQLIEATTSRTLAVLADASACSDESHEFPMALEPVNVFNFYHGMGDRDLLYGGEGNKYFPFLATGFFLMFGKSSHKISASLCEDFHEVGVGGVRCQFFQIPAASGGLTRIGFSCGIIGSHRGFGEDCENIQNGLSKCIQIKGLARILFEISFELRLCPRKTLEGFRALNCKRLFELLIRLLILMRELVAVSELLSCNAESDGSVCVCSAQGLGADESLYDHWVLKVDGDSFGPMAVFSGNAAYLGVSHNEKHFSPKVGIKTLEGGLVYREGSFPSIISLILGDSPIELCLGNVNFSNCVQYKAFWTNNCSLDSIFGLKEVLWLNQPSGNKISLGFSYLEAQS